MFGSSWLAGYLKPSPPLAVGLHDDYVATDIGAGRASPPPNHRAGDDFYAACNWQTKAHSQRQNLIKDVFRSAATIARKDERFLRHVHRSLRLSTDDSPATEQGQIATSVAAFVAAERSAAHELLGQAKNLASFGQLGASKAAYQEAIRQLHVCELPGRSGLLDVTYKECFLLSLACEEPQGAIDYFIELGQRTEALFPLNSPQWLLARQGIENLLQIGAPPLTEDGLRQIAQTLHIDINHEPQGAPHIIQAVQAAHTGYNTHNWRRRLAHITCELTRAAIENKLSQLSGASDAQQIYLEQWLGRVAALPHKSVARQIDLPVVKTKICDLQALLERKVMWHQGAKFAVVSLANSFLRQLPSATNTIGLCGPSGTGKSTLANCLGEVLERPIFKYNLHGANNSGTLFGIQRGTVGQDVGRIVADVIRSQSLEPIIILEEIDKISTEPGGQSIINKLIGLLDPHSHMIEDDFLDGVQVDLSGAIFVVTYNDKQKLPAIFSSRIQEISCPGYKPDQKLQVIEDHIFPKLKASHGFQQAGSLKIERKALEYLVDLDKDAQGVKEIEIKLRDIIGQAAVFRSLNDDADIEINLKRDTDEPTRLVFVAEEH